MKHDLLNTIAPIDWTVYWRQKQKKPYPLGHSEPFQPLENTRLAVFDMTGEVSWTITHPENTFTPPEQFVLFLQVNPIVVDSPSALVQYTYDASACKAFPIYHSDVMMPDQKQAGMQSWHQAISFAYTGSGLFMNEGRMQPFQGTTCGVWSFLLPSHGVLHTQTYETISEGLIEQKQQSVDRDNALYTPPGLKNAVVLYPYGGRYNPQGGLEDSVQMYWQPSFVGTETRIKLWSLPFLRQQGLTPPLEGVWNGRPVVFLRATHQAPVRSLNEDIIRGGIQFSCELGPGDPSPQRYRSTRYRYMDRATNMIEVSFLLHS